MTRFVPFATSLALLAFATAAPVQADDFTVSSPSFSAAAPLPERHVLDSFGCRGQNLSPALRWDHPPAGTRSFAVTLYDPDAPTGSGWWHWVVVDISADQRALPEGAGNAGRPGLPAGALQGRTDYGAPGYGGACPPEGAPPHRYVLTVHALKVERLGVPPDASPAMMGYMIHMNRLGSAVVQTTYGR